MGGGKERQRKKEEARGKMKELKGRGKVRREERARGMDGKERKEKQVEEGKKASEIDQLSELCKHEKMSLDSQSCVSMRT